MEGILALMIPIVAIVVWSPVGRALAEAIRNGAAAGANEDLLILSARLQQVEQQLLRQGEQVQLLQENSEFYKQLLEAKQETPKLS